MPPRPSPPRPDPHWPPTLTFVPSFPVLATDLTPDPPTQTLTLALRPKPLPAIRALASDPPSNPNPDPCPPKPGCQPLDSDSCVRHGPHPAIPALASGLRPLPPDPQCRHRPILALRPSLPPGPRPAAREGSGPGPGTEARLSRGRVASQAPPGEFQRRSCWRPRVSEARGTDRVCNLSREGE